MSRFRFNHMELTLPPESLTKNRDAIAVFYTDVFGFEARDSSLFDSPILMLQTDEFFSQFLLLIESDKPMSSPSFDHLGLLVESAAEVDLLYEKCKEWQAKDSRVEIKEYDDLVTPNTRTRAFYVKYLLPLWFDIQHISYQPGCEPNKKWTFQ